MIHLMPTNFEHSQHRKYYLKKMRFNPDMHRGRS
jgi:hypothetical protein